MRAFCGVIDPNGLVVQVDTNSHDSHEQFSGGSAFQSCVCLLNYSIKDISREAESLWQLGWLIEHMQSSREEQVRVEYRGKGDGSGTVVIM